MKERYRLPVMILMIFALLVGLWAGLFRLGWVMPSLRPAVPGAHGPLMVSGFLGSLLALERALALRRREAFFVPLLSGLGAVALVIGVPGRVGALLMTLSSAGFVILAAVIVRRQPGLHTVTMALGALSWLVGNGLWLAGQPIAVSVSWWAAFLILTIVGERLELSRVTRPSSYGYPSFALAVGLVISGLLLSLWAFVDGVRLANLGFVALALWLVRYDIARRNLRQKGLTRFIALNLMLGYGWLAIGGLLGASYAGATSGATYDAWLHALFLGFVFSMIFAHALIILPAATGLSVPFHPILYGPVGLMQLALVLRIFGDLALWQPGRLWGGLLNVTAILWFFLTVAVLAARERRRQRTTQAPVTES